jgi:hypothetical protein
MDIVEVCFDVDFEFSVAGVVDGVTALVEVKEDDAFELWLTAVTNNFGLRYEL